MGLPDALAVVTGACAFLGGFAGLLAPFVGGREWLDNGQRGFFVGAWIGSAGGFVVFFSAQATA